jgi:outer membrane protein assembly factor BamB/tetratricopeptide (TPR) repeat protein
VPSLPPPFLSASTLLFTAVALASLASAQGRVVAGALAPAADAPQAAGGDDPGVTVEMFDNTNFGRYLRRAQARLGAEEFDQAIDLLQQVIEGRSNEFRAEEGAADGAPPNEAPKEGPKAVPEAVRDPQTGRLAQALQGAQQGSGPTAPRQPELDARNSVYSQDDRLYRPVRRLCHELLARMPTLGLEIYRAKHEVAADELLRSALADGTIVALEQVANRYFVTLAAGRAMTLLADRLMHEGRYRGAVLVLNDLLDIYPADNRKRLGINDVWCRFKIALCLRLAGEADLAHGAVQQMASTYPQESLRVLGELHAVKDLPQDELFARDVVAVGAPAMTGRGASCIDDGVGPLVPLWQVRFANPEPYREPKSSNDNQRVFMDGGQSLTTMPYAGRYWPSTWVTFADGERGQMPRAMFFEHFRLRTADAANGLQLMETGEPDRPPVPRDMHPRVRVAASDFALLRPVEDGVRRYAIVGYTRTSSQSVEVLRASELVAYDKQSGARVWSSKDWQDGDASLAAVTFLAAPTMFGERLLMPSLREGKYTLECVDRRTGRPLWNAQLHRSGSPFWKAPGCPVVVQGGIAFVATNAGCVAAVDAFTGDLRWIRRYERIDPLRKSGKTKRPTSGNQGMFVGSQFRQDTLNGFFPSDLLCHNGLLILAPCDSDMLLCLDAASGQPQWMLDGKLPETYAHYGVLRGIVGIVDDDLFVVSDKYLIAIGASGGLVKWARELPAWNGPLHSGRGRGTVAGKRVLLPGEREILVFATDGNTVGRVAIPAFDESREPLTGSFALFSSGPWLAVGYQGGVEMFSTAAALSAVAATAPDARRHADLLSRAGDRGRAITVLADAIAGTPDANATTALANDLLQLVREHAAATAATAGAAAGLQVLDAHQQHFRAAEVRRFWHLARVELAKAHGNAALHETEQNKLYAFAEDMR